MSYLATVDRSYRGSAEAQFFDAFYGILTLADQLGGIDLVLRGSAVTAAISNPGEHVSFRVGSMTLDTLPDHRESIKAMAAAGITVYVDEPGLRALGLDRAALVPGVHCLDTSELASRWCDYDGVWFL